MNILKNKLFKLKNPRPRQRAGAKKGPFFGNRGVACDTQSAVQCSLGSYFVCPDVKTASVNTLLEQSAAELLAPIICHARVVQKSTENNLCAH